MRFSLRIHIADVQYCARRMACRDMADVRPRAWTYGQCAAGKPYFHQPSHSSCFPYFIVVLVELGLIEGFPQIWRTRIFRSIFSIQVSFNSLNAHCYFPYIAIYFKYRENIHILQLSQFILIAHELCHVEKKRCAKHVNQVELVKRHACKIQTR
jgi:hypothetical protein